MQHEPSSAPVHVAWARALCDINRAEEAIDELHEALRLDPHYVAAYTVLGGLSRESRYRFSGDEVLQMQALLRAAPASAVSDRIRLNFADKAGQYDQAFAHYREANDLKQQQNIQYGVAFDVQKHHAMIDDRIRACTPEHFARVAAFGHPAEMPVFVVGVPRSGTTLVNHILSAHPLVTATGELMDIPNLVAEVPRMQPTSGGLRELLQQVSRQTVHTLADRYLWRLQELGDGAPRVTDKLPENYLYLGFIATLFPKAKVIHCRRNPLDTCLSCYMQDFHGLHFTTTLQSLGLYYQEYQRIMAHWRSVLPLRMYEVQYEDLLERQEEVSREMIAYCGLQWDDACLSFHKNPRRVHTASNLQVRQPLYKTSIERWRRYEKHLGPLMESLGSFAPR